MIRNSLNCQHLRVPAIGIDWDEKLFSFGYVVAHGIWKSLCMDQKITFLQFSIRLVLVPSQPASLVLSQESVDSLINELSEKRCSKVYGLCRAFHICKWRRVLSYSCSKACQKNIPRTLEEVFKKVFYGEALTRGQTHYPFINYFWPKRYPSDIPSIDKWYSFHIPN